MGGRRFNAVFIRASERAGVALRFEWLRLEGHPYGFWGNDLRCCASFGQDLDMFSLTGTFDYALTDNLTVKAEARYDWTQDNESPDDFFTTARPNVYYYGDYTRDYQVMGLIEMLYRF